MPWKKLNNPFVRDLAWALFSPALLSYLTKDEAYSEYSLNHQKALDADLQWLHQLDNNPQPLIELLNQRHSTRLGIYFESLWRFYLLTRQRLLAHNLQVNDKHRTLGEMDFVYDAINAAPYHQGVINHAEAAVKFYLGCPATYNKAACRAQHGIPSDWQAWIGPNAKDRLSFKMSHMLDHQLKLSRHPLARQLLLEHDNRDINFAEVVPELILRGRFFYHFRNPIPAPTGANSEHQKGKWCYINETEEYVEVECASSQVSGWIILQRTQWFSTVKSFRETEWVLTADALIDRVRDNQASQPIKFPLLVAKLVRLKGYWLEESRAFIMPEHWPKTVT